MSLNRKTLSQAKDYAMFCLKAKLVPYVASSPGMGKSSMFAAIAKELNLKMIDIRLAQEDPTTINGFPNIDNGRSKYLPPELFPLQTKDVLPLKPEYSHMNAEYREAYKLGKKELEAFQAKYCHAGWLCHHKDTEVLTKDFGFIKFSELPKGIEVAQYDMQTKEITYAIPEGYVAYHKKCNLVVIDDQRVKFAMTEDHDLIIQSKPSNRLKEWKTYKRKPLETSISNDLVMPLAGYITTGKSSLTKEDKLAIAFQADGSITWEKEEECSICFGFSKQRKIDQFRQDFPEATESARKNGMTTFRLTNVPKQIISKDLRDIFKPSDYSVEGCKAFLEYLNIWDGFKAGNGFGYSNTNKSSISVVQEFAILSGHRCSISICEDNRKEEYSTCYKAHWYPQDYCTTQSISSMHKEAYDDMVYCLKMPKTTLITRYNDSVLISGNCFFDELPSAPRAVQAACFKILLDRLIGQHPLHEKCYLAAAGNLSTDNAIVNELSTPLRSRIIHIHIESNAKNYINYAIKSDYDLRITTFLAYKNTAVNNFQEFNNNSSDETFCCERTWEFGDRLLKQFSPNQSEPIKDEYVDLLCGTLGSTAIEFAAYTAAFKDLPTFSEIINNPTNTVIPEKPAVKFLLMGMLVGNATMDNIDSIMDYVNRFSKEYGFVFVKMLWAKDDQFLSNTKVENLFIQVADLMMG